MAMKNFSKECSLDLSTPLPKARKLSHEFVEMAFLQHGYQLLSEYQRSGDKLDFMCPQGHRHSIAWDHFKSGKRCAHCVGKIVTHAQVNAAFEAEGYTMLSQYQKNNTKIDFVCPQGHKFAITWAGFQSGKRCKYCAGQVVTHEQVNAAFEAEGYQLLSQYERNVAPMNFVCPQGHHHRITWADFNAGKRCAHCAENRALTHEQVKAAFDAEGYTMLSRYQRSDAPIAFICPYGHRHSTIWESFKQGKRCGKCFPGGYNVHRSGILYYVRLDLPEFSLWKIGITNHSVRRRFCAEPTPHEILMEQHFEDGRIPPRIERSILRTHKQHRYQGNALISGNTECFTIDVLNYDKPIRQLELLFAKT
jgi:hypothetical protein